MLPIVATSEFSRIFSSELSSLLDRARRAIETLCERPADEAAQAEILAAYHSMGSMGGMARATAIEKVGRLFERLVDVASTFGLSDPERALSIYFFCQAHLTGVREIVGVTLAKREEDAEVQAEQLRKAVHRIWGDYYYEQPRAETPPEARTPGLQPTAVRAVPPEETPAERAARIGVTSEEEVVEAPKPDEDDVLDFLAEMGMAAGAKTPLPPPPPAVEFPAPGMLPREVRPIVEPLDIKPPPPAAVPRVDPPPRPAEGSLTFVSASQPPLIRRLPAASERESKVDMEMLQFFIPETEEYCDTMDRAIETWAARPFDSIPQQTLLRLYHTIKGAANSIGLAHMGRLAHGMEDLFTALDEERLRLGHDQKISLAAKSVQVLRQCLHRATSTPPVFTVPAPLDELLRRVERITGAPAPAEHEEAKTSAPPEFAKPAEEIAAIASAIDVEQLALIPLTAAEELEERANRIIKDAAGEASTVTADAHIDVEKPAEPAEPELALVADAAAAPAVATTIDAAEEEEASETFLESQTAARIEPKRLDLLMNLVGELIVGRNQLLTRLQTFNQLQRELEAAKNRLLDVVNDFQEKYEYSPVEGGVIPPGAARPLPPGLAARRTRTATAGSDPGGEAAAPVGFSDLEFNRYDDLNILCRALVEIGADANEIITQSGRFIASFNDETIDSRKLPAASRKRSRRYG